MYIYLCSLSRMYNSLGLTVCVFYSRGGRSYVLPVCDVA